MAVIEKSGFLKYKDAQGNTNLMYPITTKDNVDGMDEIDAHVASQDNPHNVTADQIGAISYSAQSLTDEQKTQARTNIGAGTSDVKSWNELEGRPFGELPTGSDTLYWDGNREGLVRANDYEQYLISESTPTIDDFVNGASNTKLDGDTETSTNLEMHYAIYEAGDGAIVVGNSIVALKDGASVGDTIYPKKGTYFTWIGNDCYTTSLTIPGYTGFPSVKKIDEKYLPNLTRSYNTGILTGGTSSAYTATIEGITELEPGISFIMIPHATSSKAEPTLNVNNLGAKPIWQRLSTATSSIIRSADRNWLYVGSPITVTYDGYFWVAELTRPDASTINGVVPVENGGTGATTAEGAATNLSLIQYTAQTLTNEQKAQARRNIGALSATTKTENETLTNVWISNDGVKIGISVAEELWGTYTEFTSPAAYSGTVAKRSTLAGGVLRVDFDTDKYAGVKNYADINIYLFDADGICRKHTARCDCVADYQTYGGVPGYSGEGVTPTYYDSSNISGGASGYASLVAPFSTQIPDGYTVMVAFRNPKWQEYPNGNFETYTAFANWLKNEVTVSITVTKEVSDEFVSSNMGTENANRQLVTDNTGKIVVGDPVGVDGVIVPNYWKSYLDDKINTIKTLQSAGGKDCFSFAVIADLHYSENKGKCSPLLAKYVMDSCNIKYLLCLGDMQTQAAVSSEEYIHSEWASINKMFDSVWNRTLMTLGNHDGAWGQLDTNNDGSVDSYYCYNLTPSELYEYVYRKVGMINGVHFDDSGNGYYVDDPANHVRYIILNTSCTAYTENSNGTVVNNYMTKQRITQNQFDMVIEALNTIPSNSWSVVIGSHIPLISDFGDNYVGDRDLMMSVLSAFQNKTTFSGTYGTVGSWDYVSVDVNYSNAKGSIIGAFAGHMHADTSNTTKAFPIVLTTCDAEPSGDVTYEKGTTTEQSFDIFTVNRLTGKIHVTKIGYGEDRVIG